MVIHPACDFCKKELKEAGGLLFSPPNKALQVKKYHICRACYKQLMKLLRFDVDEIEEILSVGPAWLNYTKKVKRKKGK